MNQTRSQLEKTVLEEGPFSRHWVERWPESLRETYLELLGDDLIKMGLDEFRRQSPLLGKTFLLSHNRSIDRCPYLFESWYRLTGRKLLTTRESLHLM